MILNRPGKTFVPNGKDQRFIVDCWALGKFNLDITKYALTAAATVEKLNPGQKPCPWKATSSPPPSPASAPPRLSARSRAAAGPRRSRPSPGTLTSS